MKVTVVALALVLSGGGCQTQRSEGPSDLVAQFYRMHLPSASSGLLPPDELQLRRRFLSERLFSKYDAAVRRQQEWILKNPDDPQRRLFNKPPCIEGGDYFESLYEWPDVKSTVEDPSQYFEVLGTEAEAPNRWSVRVHFWYDTTPRVEWTDVVVVTSERARLAIDDIIYSGGGSFNRTGRLTEVLDECGE